MGGNVTEKVRIINDDGTKTVDVETKGSTNTIPVSIIDENGDQVSSFSPPRYSFITTDDADGEIEYMGWCEPANQNETDQSVWIIAKFTYTAEGNPVMKYADGVKTLTKSWDDRGDYTY